MVNDNTTQKMSNTVTTTKQGAVRGFEAENFDGEKYLKFLGIPYGKPPLGLLRFKAPLPPEPWDGIRDCTKEGNMCYMSNYRKHGEQAGSEDCLYLNVYTRKLPWTVDGGAKKPVLVHLHGGAFITGSGNEEFFGTPDFLMTKDIVLVNLNYRLGVLGFLSCDDPSLDIPGNAGLKDQRMALQWIQENIACFNGDPKNVTIFGLSCGGTSVHCHLLSKSCKGLFHKAIIQSGTLLSPWAWGSKNVIDIAKMLDANVATEKEAFDILKNVDIQTLYNASRKLKDNIFMSQRKRPFGVVIEKPNPTAFLTENPVDIMKSGNYNQVPIIIGCTSNEGLLFQRDFFDFIKPPHVFDKGDGVLWFSGVKLGSPQFEEVKNEIDEFYFRNNGVAHKNIHDLYSDAMFVSGSVYTVKLLHKTAKKQIYCYNFDANTKMCKEYLKFLGKENIIKEYTGSAHGSDYPYIFRRSNLHLDSGDKKIMENIITLWTSFAAFGEPKLKNNEVEWEPVNNLNNIRFLTIDVNLKMADNPFNERTKFWDKYFDRYQLKFE